ncbi:hypothetical protein D3C76_1636040 [compost metagenome]
MGPQGLAHQVGDGLADLSALDLQERAFRAGHATVTGSGDDAQVAHFDGHQLDLHFCDLRAERGVFNQRHAVTHLGTGDLLESCEHLFGLANAGDAGALMS